MPGCPGRHVLRSRPQGVGGSKRKMPFRLRVRLPRPGAGHGRSDTAPRSPARRSPTRSWPVPPLSPTAPGLGAGASPGWSRKRSAGGGWLAFGDVQVAAGSSARGPGRNASTCPVRIAHRGDAFEARRASTGPVLGAWPGARSGPGAAAALPGPGRSSRERRRTLTREAGAQAHGLLRGSARRTDVRTEDPSAAVVNVRGAKTSGGDRRGRSARTGPPSCQEVIGAPTATHGSWRTEEGCARERTPAAEPAPVLSR